MNKHGDDWYNYPGVRINFSSNIWGHVDLSLLQAHLASKLNLIAHYPAPEPYALERLLAHQLGITEGEVMVTNGATEAIYLIAKTFAHYEPHIMEPTFSEYRTASRWAGAHGRRSIHWFCRPNNPTGKVLPDNFLDDIPSTDIVVVDQSYEDYTLCPLLNDAQAVADGRLLLLHSMTKKYAIPGLRLGYVTGNKALIEQLRVQRPPWTVNALAQEAGFFLLSQRVNLLPNKRWLMAETARFRQSLQDLDGVESLPTDTHFFLLKLSRPMASELKEHLAYEYGLLVRDASNFETLDQHFIRVATQLPEENNELVRCLQQLLLS